MLVLLRLWHFAAALWAHLHFTRCDRLTDELGKREREEGGDRKRKRETKFTSTGNLGEVF